MRAVIALGVIVLALGSTGIAAANEPPQAEAGLDQDAQVNTTVFLDAGGSLDTDGEITRYEWSIETPNGTVLTPNCTNCTQTWFVPTQRGLYNVTIEIVNDDGARMEDTLFVVVEGATGPSGAPAPSPSSDAEDPSSSTTSPPDSGTGATGTGSGSAGSASQPGDSTARIVRTDDGLVLSGSLQQDEYRISVGDGSMSVSGEQFESAQTEPGAAPLTEFRGAMREADLTLDDAREAIESSPCESSRGSGCTASIGSASYESDVGEVDIPSSSPDDDDDDDRDQSSESDDDLVSDDDDDRDYRSSVDQQNSDDMDQQETQDTVVETASTVTESLSENPAGSVQSAVSLGVSLARESGDVFSN